MANDPCLLNRRFGWVALIAFMAGGLLLEALHLVKLPAYFEVTIRRELWTLAHAHGALLALLNLVYCAVMARTAGANVSAWPGRLLVVGGIGVPAGFFLGGIGNSESDPSLWIVLTPVGAAAAILGLVLSLPAIWARRDRGKE